MKKLTEKQMDYAESLIKENGRLIRKYAPNGLPNHFKVDRAYRALRYTTSKTRTGVMGKETTIDRLLRTIEQVKKEEERTQQKRDEFRAIANECIALGATAEEVKDYCKQNVCQLVKDAAQGGYESADYCDGFPGQYSDAYKTVARDKQNALGLFREITYIERNKAFTLIRPDWWISVVRQYKRTLEDPENATEND